MPVKTLPLFMKQAFPMTANPQDQEAWRELMIEVPHSQLFKSNNWNIATVKHYEVLPCQAGGFIFVDMDNLKTAKVYIWDKQYP